MYEKSKDILVADNTVWNSNVAMTCENTENVIIRGNAFDSQAQSCQPLSFWHAVSGDVLVENNILLGGGDTASGFTIAGLNDKSGATFANMRTVVRDNIMTGPMLMVMSGKPWTNKVTAESNIYLATPTSYTLGTKERVESDLGKLVGGIPEHRYLRLGPK